jgi:hypothetical protein
MRHMLALIAAATIASGAALAEPSASSGTRPAGGPDTNNALMAPGDNTSGQGAWSDERMRNAKPKPLPNVNPGRDRDKSK